MTTPFVFLIVVVSVYDIPCDPQFCDNPLGFAFGLWSTIFILTCSYTMNGLYIRKKRIQKQKSHMPVSKSDKLYFMYF